MPSRNFTHFSQSISPLLHHFIVNFGIFFMASKSFCKTPRLFSYVGRIHMVENGQNCEPRISHAFDHLGKFNEAPFRESVIFRDDDDRVHIWILELLLRAHQKYIPSLELFIVSKHENAFLY